MNPETDIACEPPLPAEVGDEWICPDCARKYYYVLMVLEDQGIEAEAWFTSEIGF